MTKETVLLSSGERVERVIRDIDFMLLCDGRQYARAIAHDGREITVARKRGEGESEWREIHTYTASISQGGSCWTTTLDAESPLQALKDLRGSYPGCLIGEGDRICQRLTITNLYEGWEYQGTGLLDEALQQEHAKAEQQQITVRCAHCDHLVPVQATQEGGSLGWTRYSYDCSCGHSEVDISIEQPQRSSQSSGEIPPSREQAQTGEPF